MTPSLERVGRTRRGRRSGSRGCRGTAARGPARPTVALGRRSGRRPAPRRSGRRGPARRGRTQRRRPARRGRWGRRRRRGSARDRRRSSVGSAAGCRGSAPAGVRSDWAMKALAAGVVQELPGQTGEGRGIGEPQAKAQAPGRPRTRRRGRDPRPGQHVVRRDHRVEERAAEVAGCLHAGGSGRRDGCRTDRGRASGAGSPGVVASNGNVKWTLGVSPWGDPVTRA